MAESGGGGGGRGGNKKHFNFSLPLKITTSAGEPIAADGFERIYNYLASDLELFKKHITTVEGLTCVHVYSISLLNGKTILLNFVVNDDAELEDFYHCTGNKVNNKLSDCITRYANGQNMEFQAGFGILTRLVFHIAMPDKVYFKGKLQLCEDDDLEENLNESDVAAVSSQECMSQTAGNNSDQSHNGIQSDGKPDSKLQEREMVRQIESSTGSLLTTDVLNRNNNDLSKMTYPNDEKATGEQRSENKADQQPRIKKEFIVYVPNKKDRQITYVNIVCESIQGMNKRMKQHHDSLYEVTVDLPDDYDEKTTYHYEVQFTYYVAVVFHQKGKKRSNDISLGNRCINRDHWGGNMLESVQGHLLDIITHCSYSVDMYSACTQIEDVCRTEPYMTLENVIYLVSNMMEKVMPLPKYRALFAITIGNIIKSTGKLQKLFSSRTAFDILQGLGNLRLDELPKSCSDFMPAVCKALCEIALQKNYCLLSYMDMCYSFYGVKRLLLMTQNVVKESKLIAPDNDHMVSIAVNFCSQLSKLFLSQASVDAKTLLDWVLKSLPFRIALYVYLRIEIDLVNNSPDENTLQTTIYGSLSTQIQVVINSAKRNNDIQFFLVHWRLISTAKTLREAFQTKFEKTVIELLGKCKSKGEKVIKEALIEFCYSFKFFEKSSMQLQLLEVIVESPTQEVQDLFLTFSCLEMMKNVYASLDNVTFKTWFETAITSRSYSKKGDDEVIVIFGRLVDLLVIPAVQCNSELQHFLEDMALKKLRNRRIEDVLRKADAIEKLSENKMHVGTLFRNLIVELVKQKLPGQKPDEILLTLCGTHGKLRVNSSFTGDIACTILDVYCDLPANMSDIDAFMYLMHNAKLWLIVFEGDGKAVHLINENKQYIQADKCLKQMIHLFRSHEIKCSLVEQLATQANDAKMLIVYGGCEQKEIDKLWNDAEMFFKEEQENLTCVQRVVSEVYRWISNDGGPEGINLPFAFDKLLSQVKSIQKTLAEGDVPVKDYMLKQGIWKSLFELPASCKYLESRVLSRVFWNVSYSSICEVFSDWCNKTSNEAKTEDDAYLGGLCDLFGEIQVEEDPSENTEHALSFLQIMVETGSRMYKEFWEEIQDNEMINMRYVLGMFCGADYNSEVEIAEKCFRAPIQGDMKTTLNLVSKATEIQDIVSAMKSCLQAFSIDNDVEFFEAVQSFEQLLEDDTTDYSFPYLKKSLQTVFGIADGLSPEAIDILHSLGRCPSLLGFLQIIVDDDIRNLIDAVEDISEQHVQESTVSGLIEVKRFLQPLLRHEFERTGNFIFKTVEKQTQAHGKGANTLPAKIDVCMDNLHNLKSLYNNLANRGEQTKETIEHINNKGCFHFTLNKDTCDFTASYKQSLKPKESQSKNKLIDLRSRAHLLMNTDRAETNKRIKNDDLEKFVGYIDLCLDITDIAYNLYQSGHIKYISFMKTEKPHGLQQLKTELSLILNNWLDNLLSARTTHFLMNFVQGTQIHTLYNYLEKKKEMEKVQTLLKYIHTDMETNAFKEVYLREKKLQMNLDDMYFLLCIGHSLHSLYEGLTVHERYITEIEEQAKRITDVVQVGKLLVAHLEESSLQVVRTILALFVNTTKKLPEANQVLFCTKETSWSEIQLFLGRCLGAYQFYDVHTLFSVANVEMLPNEIQFKFVEYLRHLRTDGNFLLSIVCRGSKHHSFIDKLGDHVMTVRPLSDQMVHNIYLNECPNVCTFTSEIAGLGKTNTIDKMAHSTQKGVVSLHISGAINKRILVERLRQLRISKYHVLHLDIGNVENHVELDTFLFELIILRYVTAGTTYVNLPTSYVSIEIANTINDSLRNSLQTAVSFKREHLRWNDYDNYIVSNEVQSPVQVVCHFLNCLESGELDNKDILFSGKNAVEPLSASTCKNLLRKYVITTNDLSFSVVNIFLGVLANQLKKMACSAFFRTSRIGDMIGHKTVPIVRSTLTRALVDVSQEFSSRSVNACRATQASALISDNIQGTQESGLVEDVATCSAKRFEEMIQWEESNHLVYVFHNQNIQTISALYRNKLEVPDHIKTLFEGQMKKEMMDFKSMNQAQLQVILQKIARTDPLPLLPNKLQELASNYALTPDNLLKMVLIMLRITSNIPVVVMGETGCGKTSLVRYLASVCEVSFSVMNIHAGVGEQAIINQVHECNEDAMQNLDGAKWLFLDEINTCEHLGLIGDVICHHRCLGQLLAPNFIVMGACNPYKLRSVTSISTAGLQGKIKTDELSRLVYRVSPLPEILVDYVWDFGSLSKEDEELYIKRMVEDVFPKDENSHNLLSELISVSQQFVRDEETSYSVSLRDVQRNKTLTQWFMLTLKKKENISGRRKRNIEEEAIILSLAHCYHSRFFNKIVRQNYRLAMEEVFQRHGKISFTADLIHDTIRQEQQDMLNRMELPPGTAKNTALAENVFVILVCILNKIPIFVVGKPGCSKSLAMQIIRSNLRGKDSKDNYFKTLPQLYCVSFQGSESSTSDGIVKVFEKAEKYRNTNYEDDVLSVVILDEIGLAEISRFNPLKVLHNLLEPDGKCVPNVAVVGISNWSLDASKMNRAVHLSRPEMDEDELFETGVSISDSFVTIKNKNIFSGASAKPFSTSDIKGELRGIARAYFSYIGELRFKNFHGLRDFYSLVKFVARTLSEMEWKASQEEKYDVIMQGIEMNFGGLPEEKETLINNFKKHLKDLPVVQNPIGKLITNNIMDPLARHLMLITTGESVLGIIQKKLGEIGREKKEIIFGSQFEEDLTDDYNYRILSRIILCMEQGLVLILKDLENIYGSLYDMLNQNYTLISKKKNCRVALGPYSNPICHVADTFRCIVLVDESKIDFTDPPFLNRFEKHYLRFADTINEDQKRMIQRVETWIDGMSSIRDKHFCNDDTFPIYSEDMVASLVLKLGNDMQTFSKSVDMEFFFEKCKEELLWIVGPEVVMRLGVSENKEICNDSETVKERYFSLPVHNGMEGLMKYQFEEHVHIDDNRGLMTIVFTNSTIHTKVLHHVTNKETQVDKLGAFKSEKQLSLRMQHFWMESEAEVLFLQCSAIDDEKHIMLAKSVIERFCHEFHSKCFSTKHVYLVIHMERSKGKARLVSQINFLSGWKLVTLDCLECPQTTLPEIRNVTLHNTIMKKRPLDQYIEEQLFWTFTRIRYTSQGRNVDSIKEILEKMKQSPKFLKIIDRHVCTWITQNYPDMHDTEWQVKVACDSEVLHTTSCFVEALETHILSVINIPLSKMVYQMEVLNILDSYFIEDAVSKQRRKSWESMLDDDQLFSISRVPEVPKSMLEPYTCESKDLSLRMPFSSLLYENIETTRDAFLDSLTLLKGTCELDEDDELPSEVFSELLLKQKSFILQQIPNITEYLYEGWENDYIADFCNIVSFTTCSSLPKMKRIEYMKWIMSQKTAMPCGDPSELFKAVHSTFWTHLPLFSAELQLLETCNEVLLSENSDLILSLCSEIEDTYGDDSTQLSFDRVVEVNDMLNFDVNFDEQEDQELNQDICISYEESDQRKKTINDGFEKISSDTELDSLEYNSDGSVKNTEIKKKDHAPKIMKMLKANEDLSGDIDPVDGHLETEPIEEINTENISDIPSTTKVGSNKVGEIKSEIKEIEVPKLEIAEEMCVLNMRVETDVDRQPKNEHIESIKFEFIDSKSRTEMCKDSRDISDRTSVPDTEKCQTPQDALVGKICKMMLPTVTTLELYNGFPVWQSKINCVLTIAARVSQEPNSIHMLRLCNDIASTLIIPYSLDVGILQNFGQLLRQGNSIDSKHVFKALLDIVESTPREGKMDCQQILSSYFIRCLSSNPSSMAITFLFMMILERRLPEMQLSFMKSPLQLMLRFEMDENADIFTEILQTCDTMHTKYSSEFGEESDNSGKKVHKSDLVEESFFLRNLDQCLKNSFIKGHGDGPFSLLLVDLLEEIYSETISKEDFLVENDSGDISLFLCAHKILLISKVGLPYIAAIAYFKAFIQSFSVVAEDENMKPKPLAIVNAAFHNIENIHVSQTMLTFFLKILGMKSSLVQVKKKCDRLQGLLPFLENIFWSEEFWKKSFDSCPLTIHIPDNVKAIETLFNETQDVDTDNAQLASVCMEACNSVKGLVLMHAIALKQFYIPRSYMTLDDTRKTQANMFIKEVNSQLSGKPTLQLLKCLVGKEDFKVPELMHGEESDPFNFMINSLLSSLYGLLLASTTFSVVDKLPIQAKCLLHPSQLQHCFLPGFPNNVSQTSCILDETAYVPMPHLAKCQCGHRLAIYGSVNNCVVCRQPLLPAEISNNQGSENILSETGYVVRTEMNDVNFGVRGLSPVVCNVLYILTKGCLLGSLALGFASAKVLEDVTSFPEKDISKTLWEDIKCHWISVSRLLNVSNNSVGLLLHVILRHTRDQLCENRNPMESIKNRLIWEEEFSGTVNKIMKDRFQMMHQINRYHLEIHGLPVNTLEQSIYELDDPSSMSKEERQAMIPNLFRIRGLPTKENFMYELHEEKHTFPFLVLVLNHCDRMELPIHIFNIVQWQIAAASNANYMMKKQECLDVTVRDFIYSSSDEKKKDIMKKRFEAFQKSWTSVKETQLTNPLERIHWKSKMSECLILGTDSAMYMVLKRLVAIQNDFLDRALGMASVCRAVKFLTREPDVSVIPCVQVSEVKKQHLINFKWDDNLLQKSQCGLSYGCGRHIYYDFHSIEKGLAINIVVGKFYLNLDRDALPKIIFTDELYRNYVTLVKELKMCVKQTHLPSEVINGIKEKKENDPRMTTELLTHLGVIMTLLNKTKGEPEKPLIDYADEWKILLTRKLPNDLLPQCSVKLCHVVALHELLEELNSDVIIDALEEQFREKLALDMKRHFKHLTEDNAKLSEMILKAIKRFAHRCLSLREADPKQPLISYLCDESFWSEGVVVNGNIILAGRMVKMVDVLPECLMVSHVHATFSFIEMKMKKLHQDAIRQSQSKPSPTSTVDRKKKTAKTFWNF